MLNEKVLHSEWLTAPKTTLERRQSQLSPCGSRMRDCIATPHPELEGPPDAPNIA